MKQLNKELLNPSTLFHSVKSRDYHKIESIIDHLHELSNISCDNNDDDLNDDNDDEDDEDDEDEIVDVFNSFDEEHKTPLHHAVQQNDIRCIELLAPHTIITSMFDNCGMTCIHIATRNFSQKALEILLQNCPNSILAVNEKCDANPYMGFTPLHFSGYWNTIARENHMDEQIHRSDTHFSSMESLTRFLLNHGAYVNALNSDHENALHICARNNTVQVAKLLIRRRVKIDQQNKSKITPLMVAAALGHVEFINLLLDNRLLQSYEHPPVDLSLVDTHGDSVLLFALQSQLQRVFTNGIAVTAANESIAYRLAHAGVNVEQVNKDGLCALDFISESFGHILKLVQKHPSLYPDQLSDLLSNISNAPNEIQNALKQYAIERHEADGKENAKQGSCPMITNNKYLMKKRGIEEPEKLKKLSHPSPMHGANGDASQCPFLQRQKQQPQATTSADATSVAPSKGKCPIPFHNELMLLTKMPFLFYIIVFISAVVVAKLL